MIIININTTINNIIVVGKIYKIYKKKIKKNFFTKLNFIYIII